MVQWVGFQKYYLPVQHADRYEGKSSYNFKNLTKLAINNILAFSDKPLRLTVRLGFFISFLSFLLAIYNIIAHFAGIIQVAGFTTTVFSIWFVAGLILVVLGIVGVYVGKTFENVKKRPTFIVTNQINLQD
jgi:dolichol-phosphate mannosyltransferase